MYGEEVAGPGREPHAQAPHTFRLLVPRGVHLRGGPLSWAGVCATHTRGLLAH